MLPILTYFLATAAALAAYRFRPHYFGAKVELHCFVGEPLAAPTLPRCSMLHCVPMSETNPTSAFAYLSLILGVVV